MRNSLPNLLNSLQFCVFLHFDAPHQRPWDHIQLGGFQGLSYLVEVTTFFSLKLLSFLFPCYFFCVVSFFIYQSFGQFSLVSFSVSSSSVYSIFFNL